MAYAVVTTREAKVTLELSAAEAAVVYGVIGMTRVSRDLSVGHPIAVAVNSIRYAFRRAGFGERMTDFGGRVAQRAVVGLDYGQDESL